MAYVKIQNVLASPVLKLQVCDLDLRSMKHKNRLAGLITKDSEFLRWIQKFLRPTIVIATPCIPLGKSILSYRREARLGTGSKRNSKFGKWKVENLLYPSYSSSWVSVADIHTLIHAYHLLKCLVVLAPTALTEDTVVLSCVLLCLVVLVGCSWRVAKSEMCYGRGGERMEII